jgi:hypothetical protein
MSPGSDVLVDEEVDGSMTMLFTMNSAPDRLRLPDEKALGEWAGREFRIGATMRGPCACGSQHESRFFVLLKCPIKVVECLRGGWLCVPKVQALAWLSAGGDDE